MNWVFTVIIVVLCTTLSASEYEDQGKEALKKAQQCLPRIEDPQQRKIISDALENCIREINIGVPDKVFSCLICNTIVGKYHDSASGQIHGYLSYAIVAFDKCQDHSLIRN